MDSSNTKQNKQRRLLLLSAAGLFIVLFLIGFFPRLFQWHQIEARAAEENLPVVVVMEAKSDKKPTHLTLPSSTDALHITPLWSRVDGYLSEFLVDIGDHVQEGQLLAVIDTPEVDKQLLQARADLQNSIAKLEIAKISANRWEELYKRNAQAVSSQEVDERTVGLKAAEAEMNASQANVERLEKVQSFNHIYAPFTGTIIERNIDIGSLITAGSNGNPQQLFKIAQMDVIRVFVNVPQHFFREIKNMESTKVFIREFPEQEFEGIVVRNARALDPTARTLLTEIHIDNADDLLVVGLYAEVKFQLNTPDDHFIVPTQAVIIRDASPRIALLEEDNKVRIIPVHIGRDFGKTMEITSGLIENNKIITNPSVELIDGSKVRVLQE